MKVADQAEMFNQAEIVIGSHGRGLANIVFCFKFKVLDIFNGKLINPCFWDLSNKLNLNFFPFFSKSPKSSQKINVHHYNIDIDVRSFISSLRKVVKI